MNKLIAFAGRKSSGKSTLSQYLAKKGYEKISFADHIKNVVAEMFGVDKYTIQEKKEEKLSLVINDNDIRFLSEKSGFSIETLNPFFVNKREFSSYREALQYIATDVLRVLDEDYHVKKTLESLDKNGYYVIDDMRFYNEKEAVEMLGGRCHFVFNPHMTNVSNHESEISLNWSDDFHSVICNSSSLEKLVSVLDNPNFKQSVSLSDLRERPEATFMLSFSVRNAFITGLLYNSELKYDDEYGFYLTNINEKLYLLLQKESNGKFIKDKNIMIITNPLIVENMKAWGFFEAQKGNGIYFQDEDLLQHFSLGVNTKIS
jgi:hypothetical protein